MSERAPIHAQVHRFGESVAVWTGGNKTVYLTPKEARAIARAMVKAARSCERETFTKSTCGTFSLPVEK